MRFFSGLCFVSCIPIILQKEVNALLTFSSAGITRIGNVMQLGNGSGRGGIPLQLGDGGGYDDDGGGYDDDDGYRRPRPPAHLRSAVRKHWMKRNEKNP